MNLELIFCLISDEEKRKMYHSTSIKTSQYQLIDSMLNTDEKEIQELMSWLLDKVDKELNPPTSNETCCVLFDAASTIHRQKSIIFPNNNYTDEIYLNEATDNTIFNDDLTMENSLLQPLDEYKHSLGILLDEESNKDDSPYLHRIPSRKLLGSVFYSFIVDLNSINISLKII